MQRSLLWSTGGLRGGRLVKQKCLKNTFSCLFNRRSQLLERRFSFPHPHSDVLPWTKGHSLMCHTSTASLVFQQRDTWATSLWSPSKHALLRQKQSACPEASHEPRSVAVATGR